jgi:hypothetical protein
LGVLWLAWHSWKERKGLLSLALLGLSLFSLASLAIPPGELVQLAVHMLTLAAILWIALGVWRASDTVSRYAVLLPGLALFFGGLYQAIQALYAAFGWPGPPRFALPLFNLGELFAVLAPIGIWWVCRLEGYIVSTPETSSGRRAAFTWRDYLVAAIPAIGFSALTLANPSMAGVLAIWSSGLTLYLPWPLYTLSLWLFGVALLALWRQGSPAGWALLLLAAGSYAPQLSSQVFYGLIGLSLISPRSLKSDLLLSSGREVVLFPGWLLK